MDLDASEARLFDAMLAEEDGRPAGQLDALLTGLEAPNPVLRRLAVRGMGRLQRPDLLQHMATVLGDEDPGVRAAAAEAIAQAVSTTESPDAADLLQRHIAAETDAAVIGALAEALGRLRPGSPEELAAAQQTLIERSRGAPIETLLPVARGLESLVRRNARDVVLSDASVDRLVELTRYGGGDAGGPPDSGGAREADSGAADAAARVRRLALATLVAAGRAGVDTVEAALADPDAELRRLATAAAERLPEPDRQARIVETALADDDGAVRYEALRVYGRRLRATNGCDPIVAALDDGDPDVAIEAIDLLGGCGAEASPGNNVVAQRLAAIAASLAGLSDPGAAPQPAGTAIAGAPGNGGEATPAATWQLPAHALVALARRDGGAAAPLIAAFAHHPTWQVRMYAARAAAAAGAPEVLEMLAADPHANVAEAALAGLETTIGDGADNAAIEALRRDDYQLLITAARALEGSRTPAALPALLDALARVTAQRRQTSRDPRRALLERIAELGGAAEAERLRPYLSDFDPLIAEQAAETLLAWTGSEPRTDAHPPDPLPLPSYEELRALDRAHAVIRMRGGGVIDIELLPFEAPTNVARFVRQARQGYFDGLTFHRVVPNFVIQGGSPGANEYVGAPAYTRDELTPRSHLRGTVGISTRGRDTGDGQIFVNLVDNVRLDHEYTIIGAVTSGMDVVDAILEGAVIETVTIET